VWREGEIERQGKQRETWRNSGRKRLRKRGKGREAKRVVGR
jgi:hypothetical protein